METSFFGLLNGSEDDCNMSSNYDTSIGIPKFKTITPPSLPISNSLSSYFATLSGLSPTELLESPILLTSFNNVLPSPTTGAIPYRSYDPKPNPTNYTNYQQNIKEEEHMAFNDFSFQLAHRNNTDMQSNDLNNQAETIHIPQILKEQKGANDGYNWRKYGQKVVKGSENPRSYYKCTFPNCQVKKKVERSADGQIAEIIYRGTHTHPKPQQSRRNSGTSHLIMNNQARLEASESSFSAPSGTPENSSVSFADDDGDLDTSSKRRNLSVDSIEHNAKRIKEEGDNEGTNMNETRTVREPKVVVQTTSDIDILDDGYRWRKYGQKVVKGNPNPRSYYKCTSAGCTVRKQVERASHDIRAVITTYEGKHNHDVPQGRGNGAVNRSSTINNNEHRDNQAPFTLEMLQAPDSYGYGSINSGYRNSDYNMYSRTGNERMGDSFVNSLLL